MCLGAQDSVDSSCGPGNLSACATVPPPPTPTSLQPPVCVPEVPRWAPVCGTRAALYCYQSGVILGIRPALYGTLWPSINWYHSLFRLLCCHREGYWAPLSGITADYEGSLLTLNSPVPRLWNSLAGFSFMALEMLPEFLLP